MLFSQGLFLSVGSLGREAFEFLDGRRFGQQFCRLGHQLPGDFTAKMRVPAVLVAKCIEDSGLAIVEFDRVPTGCSRFANHNDRAGMRNSSSTRSFPGFGRMRAN